MSKPQIGTATVKQSKFPKTILVRCPATLPKAIGLAAQKNLVSASEYMRRCITERIKADGIDPGTTVKAA